MGRRWRPDPLVRKYPSISSYAGFGNNPIYYVDEDGRDPRKAGKKVTIDPTRMSVIKSSQVADNFNKKKYDEELYVNADRGFGVGLLNSIPILDRFVTKTAQKLNPLIDLLDLITNEPTDQWIAASQSDYYVFQERIGGTSIYPEEVVNRYVKDFGIEGFEAEVFYEEKMKVEKMLPSGRNETEANAQTFIYETTQINIAENPYYGREDNLGVSKYAKYRYEIKTTAYGKDGTASTSMEYKAATPRRDNTDL